MTRNRVVASLALLALTAAPAAAKEISSARICGASGCVEVDDERTMAALFRGGSPVDPPAKGAAWFRANLTVRAEGETVDVFRVSFVPSRGLMGSGNAEGGYMWTSLSDRTVRRLSAATDGLVALPAAELEGTGPVRARVDEVVLPPDDPAPSAGPPWGWIIGGLGAAALAGAFTLRRFRPLRGLLRMPRPR